MLRRRKRGNYSLYAPLKWLCRCHAALGSFRSKCYWRDMADFLFDLFFIYSETWSASDKGFLYLHNQYLIIKYFTAVQSRILKVVYAVNNGSEKPKQRRDQLSTSMSSLSMSSKSWELLCLLGTWYFTCHSKVSRGRIVQVLPSSVYSTDTLSSLDDICQCFIR